MNSQTGASDADYLATGFRHVDEQSNLEKFQACLSFMERLEDPPRVLQELYRVLRRGGRLVCAEPDWGTLTIASQDRHTVRRVVETWGDQFRQGWIGRELLGLVQRLRLTDVTLSGHLLVAEGFSAADTVFDISRTVELLSKEENTPRYRNWLADLRHADTNCPILATVTLFLISGRKD